MTKSRLAAGLSTLVVSLTACNEPTSTEELVARAGDYELTVDQIVDLLVDEERLSPDVGVVRSLADYWIDYTLLASAVDADSTFSDLDLEPLVENQLWQIMLGQLRDSVIQADTFITEGELAALYEEDDPEVELRARHILLTYPVQATQTQRDSVRAFLDGLRGRIVSGDSFEDLARRYSHDIGTAAAGGDLGVFGRGDMVAPFEQAALALEPGEVSGVVQTPLGLHLIRLEDRTTRGFAEVADAFRRRVQAARVQEAESTFVAGLEARVTPEVVDGAYAVARELARNPEARLSRRAARRPLVEWDGGAVTVGGLQDVIRIESQALRSQLADDSDDRVDLLLRDLARRELLVDQARSAGLQPPRAQLDSMVVDARRQLRNAARSLGFFDLDQAPGEPRRLAIARAVEEALEENLTGASTFVPLGIVRFQLRERVPVAHFDTGAGTAIVRIAQLRASRSPSLFEETFDPTAAPGDTVGR